MRFIVYSQWNLLPDSANTLFSEREQESLFFSRAWLENLTTHALAEDQSILLACVVENECFLAILPLLKHPEGNLSSLSTNFTTLYSLLISNNDQQDSILVCLAHGLSQLSVQPIQFEPIDAKDENIIKFRQQMESHGFQSHPYFRFYNWMHPLNGKSFDEYMAERPARLRNTIRRKKAKLERKHGYDICLYKDTGINQALVDYDTIYRASWKTNEFFSNFTPSLVKSLSRIGWSRFAILYINEQPVAAQIWFVVHSKANIYRLVFDENWKSYSPGSILTQYLMRYVIDTDNVTEIDFLTGNERYKQDWMTVRRERLGIRFAQQPEQKSIFSRAIQSLNKILPHN